MEKRQWLLQQTQKRIDKFQCDCKVEPESALSEMNDWLYDHERATEAIFTTDMLRDVIRIAKPYEDVTSCSDICARLLNKVPNPPDGWSYKGAISLKGARKEVARLE